MTFEDPIQFDILKKVGSIEIVYTDLMEISQGGPEAGSISVNGKSVQGRYGGPCLIEGNSIYIPTLVKKFFSSGFKLGRINAITLEIEFLTDTKNLIFIDRIEGDRIFFFEDLSKDKESSIELRS